MRAGKKERRVEKEKKGRNLYLSIAMLSVRKKYQYMNNQREDGEKSMEFDF